jgi:lipoate-protein ligase B
VVFPHGAVLTDRREKSTPPVLSTHWLGLQNYQAALKIQLQHHRNLVEGSGGQTLLLVEHEPVYTFGKRGGEQFLLRSRDELTAMGAELVSTDRGGLVTFHGPGQLVAYPIIRLRALNLNLTTYITRLVEAVAVALKSCGVLATTRMDQPGIYVENRKIGAVGVRYRDGVTYHGCAVNLNPDLLWFDNIVSCGLSGVKTTSVLAETGSAPDMREFGDDLALEVARTLGLKSL